MKKLIKGEDFDRKVAVEYLNLTKFDGGNK